MRNTITLNGIASTTIAGLLIQELPAIVKPAIRTTIEEIDGRDGDIVTELGYSAYDKEITIGLYGSFDINAVIAYFATEGTVTFSNEPDKFYRYKIIDQIDYERLVRYRTATVKLHCQPFKYPTSETPVQLGSGQTVAAEGTNITMQGTALAPFVSITPKGDTFQQTYTGKNLAKATNVNLTDSSYTLTISNSHIYVNSKSADNSFDLCGGLRNGKWLPTYENANDYHLTPADGGTYTLSAPNFQQSGIPTNWVLCVFTNQRAINNTFKTGTDFSSATITLQTDEYIKSIYLWAGGNAENGTVQFDLQLEAGSSPTSFEPYVGGTASPNPDYPQAVQVVTGEQTVKVNGKNLFDINGVQQANTRCTGTVNGNAITITSTVGSTGFYSIILPNSDELLGKTATISFGSVDSNHKGKVNIYETLQSQPNSVGGWVTAINAANVVSSGHQTFTFPDSHTGSYDSFAVVLYVGNRAGSTAVGDYTTYSEIQLELGETATDYESYGSQEYTLDLTSNLYDSSTNTAGKYLTNAGVIASSVNWNLTDYIAVTAGAEYEYSGLTNAGNAPYTCYFDSNKTFVSSFKQAIGTNIITIPSGVSYVRFPVQNADIDTFKFRDLPNQIELCEMDTYQDYLYKSGDKWYVHKEIGKVILDGTEGWKGNSNVFYSLPKTDSKMAGLSLETYGNLKSICSHFTKNTYEANIIGQYYSGSTNLNFNWDGTHTNLAAFKTWLASNDVRFYAPLATATNTQITDTALIEQLNALGNANSYRDTTYITTASDGYNMPVIIAATATGEADGTVTNAGNTYAKPKLTIYGTGTIGIYLNGSQIFQIELGSEGHITIDTEKMEAYKDSESNLKNRLVTGDYSKFRLEAGANQINFSGNINKCVVENYTRWL